MTREQAKEWIKIWTAYAEGKTLQFMQTEGWRDLKENECYFDSPVSYYRVKPEPREFWLEHIRNTGHPEMDWQVHFQNPERSDREVIHVHE